MLKNMKDLSKDKSNCYLHDLEDGLTMVANNAEKNVGDHPKTSSSTLWAIVLLIFGLLTLALFLYCPGPVGVQPQSVRRRMAALTPQEIYYWHARYDACLGNCGTQKKWRTSTTFWRPGDITLTNKCCGELECVRTIKKLWPDYSYGTDFLELLAKSKSNDYDWQFFRYPQWTYFSLKNSKLIEKSYHSETTKTVRVGIIDRIHRTQVPLETRFEENGSVVLNPRKGKLQCYAIKRNPPLPPREENWTTLYKTCPLQDVPDDCCSICTDKFNKTKQKSSDDADEGQAGQIVKLKLCSHVFHRGCINEWFDTKTTCPLCNKPYGIPIGSQPPGQMRIREFADNLPGYDCETIEITWEIFPGIQSENHQNNGHPFRGDTRIGYLPNNSQGREILELLKVAFHRRHMFTVGRSATRNKDDVVIWNGIHAKTETDEGGHGYPAEADNTYFDNVKAEMKLKGITVDDLTECSCCDCNGKSFFDNGETWGCPHSYPSVSVSINGVVGLVPVRFYN